MGHVNHPSPELRLNFWGGRASGMTFEGRGSTHGDSYYLSADGSSLSRGRDSSGALAAPRTLSILGAQYRSAGGRYERAGF